jgi:hypothetical protein
MRRKEGKNEATKGTNEETLALCEKRDLRIQYSI